MQEQKSVSKNKLLVIARKLIWLKIVPLLFIIIFLGGAYSARVKRDNETNRALREIEESQILLLELLQRSDQNEEYRERTEKKLDMLNIRSCQQQEQLEQAGAAPIDGMDLKECLRQVETSNSDIETN